MQEASYALLKENTASHWWNISKDRILSELIASLDIPPKGNILELGVGTGKLLSQLKFVNKFGIDLYVYPEGYNGFSFIRADANRLPVKEGTIDLLLLIDILEHIEDDQGFIENCFKVLNKNGKLLIFVPALPVLWSDLDEKGMHFRRYTAKDINRLLANSNIEHKIIRRSYANLFLLPFIFCVRIIQKGIKRVIKEYDSSSIKAPVRIINSIFKFVFSSERLFLRFLNFPIGVSYLCIIKKV
jgi:ubiquinone/menaquinone biosynthesis C-methylase UbiE